MERSAGAVIFYKNKESDAIEYLLLHYPRLMPRESKNKGKIPGHWDFPKGHIEKGETEWDTMSREVAEETGMRQLQILPHFRETIRYIFQKEGRKVTKEVVFFLAEAPSREVHLSYEHLGFTWLPFEEALELVTYKNAKAILQKAHTFLSSAHGYV